MTYCQDEGGNKAEIFFPTVKCFMFVEGIGSYLLIQYWTILIYELVLGVELGPMSKVQTIAVEKYCMFAYHDKKILMKSKKN